jgi:hypothetical protein
MMYHQMPSKMWALDRDHVDTIVEPSHQQRETMVTVYLRVNDIGLVKIRAEATESTSEHFRNQVSRETCSGSGGGWAA